jgi:hypothetical protein
LGCSFNVASLRRCVKQVFGFQFVRLKKTELLFVERY